MQRRRSLDNAARRDTQTGVNRRASRSRSNADGGACRCCARILLSVLRTLVHGAFPWLQPRSPVVQEVVESGPDHPDAVAVVLESARAAAAPAARGSPRASRPGVAPASRRGNRPASPRLVVADARAVLPRRAAVARAVAVRAAPARVAVRGAAGRSLGWHA